MVKKIIPFLGNNYNKILILIIILTSAFLRIYRISDYMTFLGDEGRDVIIVKGILEGNFTLLGPRVSAADFFTGPIYYYLMAPFLWLSRLDPVGPAVMIALFGIATVYLVYRVAKELFNETAGIIASSLYAVSPLVIAYSRSSWNPNPMPFFSLITLFTLYKTIKKTNWKYFLLIGILLGISIQLHYQAVVLALVVAFFIFIARFYITKKIEVLNLIKYYTQVLAGFIIGFSPFLLFEVRHGFPNTKTVITFVLSGNLHQQYTEGSSFLGIISNVFFRLFGRLLTRFPPPEQISVSGNLLLQFWQVGTILLAIVSLLVLFKMKNKLIVIFFSVWLFTGILSFSFYKKAIYDYYFSFMFPLPFLLLSNSLSSFFKNRKFFYLLKISSLLIFFFLIFFNLLGMPFRFAPNRQKEQVKAISDFVLSKTVGKPFNFALITGGNSDHAYRYFFELADRKPVTIENPAIDLQRRSVTNQLMVVCEDPYCQPLGNSLWEVAGFGRATISGEWQVSVVKVYRLEHYMGKN
ncbi:MAG: hypothetical protein A2905_00580 [Candidatus Levybacteria bacterium RIFCSPLOWO2_01_FULL_36_10]|nr:MAG: hypothetical protein A2905_00580 [Candidatus Levybacteria bacterium RIFCSPLOWO2_01_FULL_36_10]